MVALALREAFRYRLLTSKFCGITTILAVFLSVSWAVLVVYSFFVLVAWKAGVVAVASVVIGLLCRLISGTLAGGSGPFSPEHQARQKWEGQIALRGIQEFHRRPTPAIARLIQKHSLAADDLHLLYYRLLRSGLPSDEALIAVGREEVVSYYFEHIGRRDIATAEQADRLSFIARRLTSRHSQRR
jgi:hypothetical protein